MATILVHEKVFLCMKLTCHKLGFITGYPKDAFNLFSFLDFPLAIITKIKLDDISTSDSVQKFRLAF